MPIAQKKAGRDAAPIGSACHSAVFSSVRDVAVAPPWRVRKIKNHDPHAAARNTIRYKQSMPAPDDGINPLSVAG